MHSTGKKGSIGFSAARRDVAERAFAVFDTEKTGLVPLDTLIAAYDTRKHPVVANGDLAPAAARAQMVTALSASARQHNNCVAFEDFVLFHQRMSDEVDLIKGKQDLDKYYVDLVSQLWKLDVTPLEPTGIVPVLLDAPTGLLATRHMHLVWKDADSARLVGYRNVVKPTFGRRALPEHIRGYFAFPEELKECSVTWLTAQAAIQAPFHVVWETDSKSLRGVKSVVVSNVDLTAVPAELRAILVTAKEAATMDIDFIEQTVVVNPMYQRSNAAFGDGVEAATAKNQQEKMLALSGMNPVGVYAGRTGKFTSTFGGGMPQATGLNFTVAKKSIGGY